MKLGSVYYNTVSYPFSGASADSSFVENKYDTQTLSKLFAISVLI